MRIGKSLDTERNTMTETERPLSGEYADRLLAGEFKSINEAARALLADHPDAHASEDGARKAISFQKAKRLEESAEESPNGTAPSVSFDDLRDKGTAAFAFKGRLDKAMSVDELLASHGVNLSIWEVERIKVGSWGVTAKIKSYEVVEGKNGRRSIPTSQHLEAAKNYKIEATLVKKGVDPAVAFEAATERFLAKLKTVGAPVKYKASERAGNTTKDARARMLEISITDLHVGKLARRAVTGLHDWDSKIASSACLQAAKHLVEHYAAFGFSRILLPVGNDWFHCDTVRDTTTNGDHKLDADVRIEEAFDIGCDVAIDLVELLRSYAPVHLLYMKGNHDELQSKAMARTLRERYHGTADVTIDDGNDNFKFHRWGNVLLGYCHGQNEPFHKLPLEMATRAPKDFAECNWREWHVGHGHRMKSVGMVVDGMEEQSLRVRMLPSLCASDYWHASRAYHNLRSAEAYLWHKERAYEGHASFNLDFVR